MGWLLNRKFLNTCSSGTREEVELLLNEGADIMYSDVSGWTGLYVAARDGKIEVVQLLIERKADLNAGHPAHTPLSRAISLGRHDVAVLLMRHGAAGRNNWTTLHCAASGGYIDTVRMLIEKGADIHAKNAHDRTPEDLAMINRHYDIAKLLHEIENPPPPPPPPAEEGWQKTPDMEEVIRITEKKAAAIRLTDIFNFEERLYTRISRNLETNAEGQSTRFFDEFPDTALLEKAHQELIRRGGKTDAIVIHRAILKK